MTLNDLLLPIPDDQIPVNIKNQDAFTELLVESDGNLSRVFAPTAKDAWKAAVPSFGDKVNVVEFTHSCNGRWISFYYICNRHLPTLFSNPNLFPAWQRNPLVDSYRGEHALPL